MFADIWYVVGVDDEGGSNLARRRRTSTRCNLSAALCIPEADFRHITEMSPCPAPGLVQGQLRCPALVLVVGNDWIEDTVQLNLQLGLQVRWQHQVVLKGIKWASIRMKWDNRRTLIFCMWRSFCCRSVGFIIFRRVWCVQVHGSPRQRWRRGRPNPKCHTFKFSGRSQVSVDVRQNLMDAFVLGVCEIRLWSQRRQLVALIQVERVDLHKLVRWHAFGSAHGLDGCQLNKNLQIEVIESELTFWWPCSRQSVVHLFEQLWTWIETW